MEKNYSKRFKDILGFSKEEAQRTGYNQIIPEHLLLGLIREGSGRAIEAISHFGTDINNIKISIDKKIINSGDSTSIFEDIAIDKTADRILKISVLEARLLSAKEIDSEHLLLAILKEQTSNAAQILEKEHISYGKLYSYLATTPQNHTEESIRSSFANDDDE